MDPSRRELRTFNGLRRIIARLRGPGGCPWDRVQTHRSLRPYLLEEAYETLSGLDEGDPELLCEELGDLLLQVLLHIQLAEEDGEFRLEDVVESISTKLVRRHPHVFADAVAESPEAVVEQWDELKRRERGAASALSGIPLLLPALARAQAVQRRAAGAGFRFESLEQALQALEEELKELQEADTPESRQKEAGDALFALANVVRWHGLDAEDALRDTTSSFSRRFQRLEEIVRERGISLEGAGIDEKLALWEETQSPSD